jgi:prevent-host-death family protein
MDRHLTASEARADLLALVDAAQQGERAILTKRGVPAAALIESLRALARLWQDPVALRAMRRSFEDLRGGRIAKVSTAPSLAKLGALGRRRGRA